MTARGVMTFVSSTDPEPSGEQPPGKRLADQLARGVVESGLLVSEDVDDYESYGWSFVARGKGGTDIWCMLQASDEWLLITEPRVPLLRQLFGTAPSGPDHRQVCEAIDAAARRDERISHIRWFSLAEFKAKAAGAERP